MNNDGLGEPKNQCQPEAIVKMQWSDTAVQDGMLVYFQSLATDWLVNHKNSTEYFDYKELLRWKIQR